MRELIEEINNLIYDREKYLILIKTDYLEKIKNMVIQEEGYPINNELKEIYGVKVEESNDLSKGENYQIIKFYK